MWLALWVRKLIVKANRDCDMIPDGLFPPSAKSLYACLSEQQGKRSPISETVDSVGREICDLIVLAWRTGRVACYLFTVFSGVPETNGEGGVSVNDLALDSNGPVLAALYIGTLD